MPPRILGIGLTFVLMTAMALPKSDRGLRCTTPFCDFECVRQDTCNMGDMGADIDIDVWMVRGHASY